MPDLVPRADGLDRRLIPPGVHDARARAFTAVLARAADRFDPRRLVLTDPDTVDARLLPALVRAWSVEEFVMEGMPERMIRSILKNAVRLHASKGTVAGIRRGLALLDMEVEWRQWHQLAPKGPPNTYAARVFVGGAVFAEETILSARHVQAGQRMIDGMIRHSQEGSVRFGRRVRDEVRFGLFTRVRERVATLPLLSADVARAHTVRWGLAVYAFHRVTTLPKRSA